MTTSLGEKPLDLIIVGAGFSGIAMAIRAAAAGIDRFLILEKADDIGGTWRDNTYPGAASDIPSHLYSLSFAPRSDWSRRYPRQPELQAYLHDLVREHGLRERIRLGTEMRAAAWDVDAGLWRVETSNGELRARTLVAALGGLHHPALPALPGLDAFAGACFHSAKWDHTVDLAGKRVGVIGTGASAVQIVPEIVGKVGHLSLFQRSPPWVMPRWDMPISERERARFAKRPLLRKLHRASIFWRHELVALIGFTRLSKLTNGFEVIARTFLRSKIKDEALREKVTPRYRMGCKRVLVSDDYYPALARSNVTVVTDPIREVLPPGIAAEDGREYPLDVLILATGFDVTGGFERADFKGRDGLSLAQAWRDGMDAFQGISVHGFPNLFLLLGPNTGLGHNSVLLMMEAQVSHILAALLVLRRDARAVLEVTRQAQDDFRALVDSRMRGSIWTSGGCSSWYLDREGRNRVLWPGSVLSYLRRTRRFQAKDYELRRAPPLPDGTRIAPQVASPGEARHENPRS